MQKHLLAILTMVAIAVVFLRPFSTDLAFSQQHTDKGLALRDSTYEKRITEAWNQANAYREAHEGRSDSLDPQWHYASEFFQYYMGYPRTPTGITAGGTAFLMWGNLGADDPVTSALAQLTPDAAVWSWALNALNRSYGMKDRMEEYYQMLKELTNMLKVPDALADIHLTLAEHYNYISKPDLARASYHNALSVTSDSNAAERARGGLYELDSLNVGQLAPDFHARTLDGDTLTLSSLRGKTVLLDFWATWCGPCVAGLPRIKAIQQKRWANGLMIIGISLDEDLASVQRYLQKDPLPWTQICDQMGYKSPIVKQYNVWGIPRLFIIDQQRHIVAKDPPREDLEAQVKDILNLVKK